MTKKPGKASKARKGAKETGAEKLSAINAADMVLGESKDPMNCKEMVEAMSTEPGNLVGIMLREIGDGKEKLKAMLEFVTAAQFRVGSAAAIVYPETGPAVDEAGIPR